MSAIEIMTKDPDDVLDYDVDLSRWLPDGDFVASAAATITGGTATVTEVNASDDLVKVWISGGDAGDEATVHVLSTTDQGRVKDVAFRLRIRSV